MSNLKKYATPIILLFLIPLVAVLGAIIFKEKYYAFISVFVAVLALLPLFYSFNKKQNSSKELVIIAVMVALSAIGRFIFAWLPGFKPVTAITIIAAIYLGREAGFAVGAMSAVISNFYFGQGPFTPFQMFSWGLIGFLAGVLSKPLQKNKVILCVFGGLAGVLYSTFMDVFTTLWADGGFNVSRYLASIISALPVTVEYVVSNIIFLLLLTKPIGLKLNRIKTKYGLFQ